MAKSKIEWTEVTWNPSTGCSKISEGCKYCYAEKMALRLKAMGLKKYWNGFKLTCHNKDLDAPYAWKKPRIVFVNSMSDLFHEDMPLEFIQKVFSVMNDNPRHIFQVLTKRANVLREYSPLLKWSENIWMGVTVENNNYTDRIDELRKISAAIKFVSFEPLLGPIEEPNLQGIDWVIVGGESGPKSRTIKKEWICPIKDLCESLKIPFFFKQWGGKNKKANGNTLSGKKFLETPQVSLEL